MSKIKVKLNIPELKPVICGSNKFNYGKLYRCVGTSEYHPQWINCIAWVSRDDREQFGLVRGNVHVVMANGELYPNKVQFPDNYQFTELPAGSSIELSIEEKLNVP